MEHITKREVDRHIFKCSKDEVSSLVKEFKEILYTSIFENCSNNHKKLTTVLNGNTKKKSVLWNCILEVCLIFFNLSISSLLIKLKYFVKSGFHTKLNHPVSLQKSTQCKQGMSLFIPTSQKEAKELIMNSKLSSCMLNTISTMVLKKILPIISPAITPDYQ